MRIVLHFVLSTRLRRETSVLQKKNQQVCQEEKFSTKLTSARDFVEHLVEPLCEKARGVASLETNIFVLRRGGNFFCNFFLSEETSLSLDSFLS